MLFSEYANRWERTVLPIIDKQASRDTFKSHLKIITPIIGDKELTAIDGMVQQDLIRELKGDDERSARTVKAYMQTLRYVLAQAVTEGLLKELPAKPKLPKVHRKQQPWLRWDEMRDIIAVAGGKRKQLTKIKMLFAILAETGCRIGEAVGLKWGDFNFEKRTLHIQRSVYKGKEQPPKTPSAIRTVALSTYLVAMLEEFKPEGAKPTDLLFTTRTGSYWEPSKIWGVAKRVFEKLGMKMVGFHSWRRASTTCCRVIIGMPTVVVDHRTGHVSQGLTDGTYTTVEDGDDQPYIERLGELLFGDGLEGLKKKFGYTIKE